MKTILDKINKAYELEATKTELAKHEVELASLQNVIKLDDAALKLKEKTLAAFQKAKEVLINASNNTNQTIGAFEKVIAEVDAVEKSAKELGIALPNDARVARDSAKREISQFTELKNKVNSIKF